MAQSEIRSLCLLVNETTWKPEPGLGNVWYLPGASSPPQAWTSLDC